jgi:NADPH-dependent 2,4-dienoyl-CoA reductase/sulfur reductase-like enzyme/rhodanese-related sulfurtransferase
MPEHKKIVIVGGVAGGASAATRARRLSEDAEIVVFERGPYVSFANCGLPYHVGGVIAERERLLVQTPEGLRARFGLDVRTETEVLAVDRAGKTVLARELKTGREYRESYDALILSPGAEALRPPIPGVDHPRVLTLRNMGDMDAIIAAAQNAGRAVVVGAGYIGLELAESLRHRGLEVTLVEKLAHVMGLADPEMTAPLHAELVRHGIVLRLRTSVKAFFPKEAGLEVQLDEGERLYCDFAVLAVGVRPEVRLAKAAGLELGPRGGIRVDGQMRTSDPAIWAVGDAVEVKDLVTGDPCLIPLAGPANRQGRIAADSVMGRESRYASSQGTGICKVFDVAFAMTGLTETALKAKGRDFRRIYVHPASHATYYPGAHPVSLKLLFDPKDGRILGAQAVGPDGVDKRIDVLAVAQRAGLTVYDLEELELCYAPPFGSAKDVVNMAGFVAANVLRGDAELWEPEDLRAPEGQLLLDVRTPEEFKDGHIPGAVNLPVDELRGRLAELPRDKTILAYCQVGLRGYLACRILSQRGLRAKNLSGGFKRWQMWGGESLAASGGESEMLNEDGAVRP